MSGLVRIQSIKAEVTCDSCGGLGVVGDGETEGPCAWCNGAGSTCEAISSPNDLRRWLGLEVEETVF